VPSHLSARSDWVPERSSQDPTAVQAVAAAHDTPWKPLRTAPAGSGTGCTDHEVPFHRSASGTLPPEVLSPTPTARQLPADVQDTPNRALSPWPTGGIRIGHEVPFHVSASGTLGLLPALPTATHELAEAHDTASRMLSAGRGTLGIRWTDHEAPFHRSARVRPRFAGLGVGWIDHDVPFLLDRAGPLVVGGGCSGHAFKFGPLLGEFLADLALGKDIPVPRERFSLRRPALAVQPSL
jgi:glycine/D-amino acid oxidase-like deaminating enzyme